MGPCCLPKLSYFVSCPICDAPAPATCDYSAGTMLLGAAATPVRLRGARGQCPP